MKRIKMKFATNAIVQPLMLVAQALNWNVSDDELKPIVLGILTAGQGILALVAHYSNPDGSDVAAAYERRRK
jgi:hypothetical protein